MKVTMKWTRRNAIQCIYNFDKHKKSYLMSLSDYELFNIGLEVEAWTGKNPFKDTKQEKLEVRD